MYKLYVGKMQKIPENARFSHYDSKHNDILIFLDGDAPEGFKYVDEKHYNLLNNEQRAWLLSAKMRINAEELQKHSAEYESIISDFLDLFEEELKKEREKDGKERTNEQNP